MNLTHQRPLAILFASAITLALWSPTLSHPLQANATPDSNLAGPTRTSGAIVFAAAPSSPVLM